MPLAPLMLSRGKGEDLPEIKPMPLSPCERGSFKLDSGVELGRKRRGSTAYSLSSMKWRAGGEVLEDALGSQGCRKGRERLSRGEGEDLRLARLIRRVNVLI